MNKKLLPIILVIVLGLALFFIKRYKTSAGTASAKKETRTTDPWKKNESATTVDRDRGFDRRVSFIEYTKHATCRMGCRHITQAEVEAIMREGTINYKKSNVEAHPCPEYALEGVTSDSQRVRIVFAQCDYKTKVVTTIDLDTDWSCDCPGDDAKRHNNN